MSLSCYCPDDLELEPGCTYWQDPNDYSILTGKRRSRCSSCKELIDIGSTVAFFDRFKVPDTEIECRIYGEDLDCQIPRAPFVLCELCADMHFNLAELGYCSDPTGNQSDRVKEHIRLQNFLNTKVKCPNCEWSGSRRDVDGSDYCGQCLHVANAGLIKLEPTHEY